jgi:hypothetical protein
MVAFMSNRPHEDWRELEDTSDAVRRLTAMIDERNARKAAEGLKRSAQFADQPPQKSLVGRAEKSGRDSERKHGSTALKLPGRQLTPPQGGGIGGDPVAEVGISNGIGNAGGQTGFGISSSLKCKDTACPALDEALGDRSRPYSDAPEDL